MTDTIPTAITTFSPEYYEKWGRECLASLVKYWPGKIVAYYEHDRPDEFTDRVRYRNLFEQRDLTYFLKWTGMVPLINGHLPDGGYNYNFNANKFARKVYAITDYAREEVPFFFVGADTRCIKPVPAEFLTGLMDGYPGVFLLRRHLEKHVESDFAGYDPTDRDMRKMLRIYREAYNNGSFLELEGWNDCYVLDRLLDDTGLIKRINNLSDGVKGAGRLGINVWPNTVLAEYMIHLKGMSKKGREAA